MSADEQLPVDRHIWKLLPDYVSGLIWMIDILWITALNTSASDLSAFTGAYASLLRPFKVPEFAVGFLVIVTGVMLPFAAARALNPIVAILLSATAKYWFRTRPNTLITPEHLKVAAARLRGSVGIPPPTTAWPRAFMQYLRHHESQTVPSLVERRNEIEERTFLAFPVSIGLGLSVVSLAGIRVWPVLTAFVLVGTTLLAAIHKSHQALRNWNSDVLLAFLVATGSVDAIKNESSGEEELPSTPAG